MVEKKITKEDEPIKFKGKYIKAIGRRKTSSAQARLYRDGRGLIVVNGLKINQYFSEGEAAVILQPLKLVGRIKDFDFSVLVRGGGKSAQAEAVRHAVTRSLIAFDKEMKPALKVKGFLTRDARKTERKKPGLKKARRAPQWSKR
ncbi:MAG: 30S ribosomal protein S9 [Patescibacteria group bacterium]|nr:30S ribosomal protein S9 [Patescibacteria group bacterium]MDD5294548.1 30S ribosomal protein S9 [Patescibacteria group bacterium]MDD5554882.1 30S ribosomal protein S9 [Patescibacteria group bacterium]